MQETIDYLNRLLKKDDIIVIGLSGGPDSMCLLNLILCLNKQIKIICAHINHGLRQESHDEQLFVEQYCKDKNLILETIKFNKKNQEEDYNELELRIKRYEYFEKIVKKYKAQYLFTAHHGDDLIETILMRISRGSNLKGYSGFQLATSKKTYQIIKPLIYMTKDEIEIYNKEHNIPSVIDKSNLKDAYTRNRYRHHVLPFLKSENKKIHLKYLKFSNELIKYQQYVDNIVKQELTKRYKNNILSLTEFSTLDNLIQTKIIEYILNDLYPHNLYLVNDKHLKMILDIINNSRPNIEINLPDNVNVIKSYDTLKLSRNNNIHKDYNILFDEKCTLPNGRQISIITNTDKSTNYYIRLNSKEIKLPLYIRTRQIGDKMLIKNMHNYKKLKDIYINSKLSITERETQPVVVDSNGEIIWLPGLKKSKFDKAKNEIYDIILWYN